MQTGTAFTDIHPRGAENRTSGGYDEVDNFGKN